MSESNQFRIGDAERDEAVRILTDHHSSGRLTTDEFDERMSKALEARTKGDLQGLFTDLPGPKPGELLPLPPEPAPIQSYDDTPDEGLPWYAQWWLILLPVLLSMIFDIRFGWMFPVIAIWLWVIYPSIHQQKKVGQVRSARRPLTLEEQQRVMSEVRIGRKVQAIKMYRELTGAGLKEAKDTIDDWERRQIGY